MKTFLLGLVLVGVSSLSVAAQTGDAPTSIRPTVAYTATVAPVTAEFRPSRPSALPALYMAHIGLQGYDAYSTLHVLRRGGVEANPLMQSAVKSVPVFLAVKGGTAAVTIIAVERLWKRGHRVAAVGVMITSNLMMSAVAQHNYTVAQQMR